MSRIGIEYSLATACLAMLIGGAGSAIVGGASGPAVWVGAMIGLVLQVAVFWVLFLGVLRDRWAVAHGVGVMVRMVAVALVTFMGVPAWGLRPAPLLFSLVACLVGSTLLEPIFLKRLLAGPGAGELAVIPIEH